MATDRVRVLMMVVDADQAFILADELFNASDEALRVQKTFEETWIDREREQGGISRTVLRAAMSGKGTPEAIGFARDWKMLQQQIAEPLSAVEMTDEWFFTFRMNKKRRVFRFPYCSMAMSTCNRLIQYCNEGQQSPGTLL